jgi:hypothetical protein
MIHGMQGVLGAPDGVAVPCARAFALEGVCAASRRSGMRPDRLGGRGGGDGRPEVSAVARGKHVGSAQERCATLHERFVGSCAA